MKSFNSMNQHFIVDWKNIKNLVLNESERVCFIDDYDENTILFI